MRDDRQETPLNLSTSGISSINVSIEIDGVVYTGVLFAKKPSLPMMLGGHQIQNHTSSLGKTSLGLNSSCVQIHPSCCSSSSSTTSTSSVHRPGNSSP
ncbi:AT-rich interactive domain-containing protein 3A-like [Oncorhynchus keta]|uniref:AT-rich interactive domain-containing protein 3A-like n=1 Tax=Oncorhynchus keta TaxID=8018 RepID=UPI00227B8BE4|nr:AT-rich interactive domain-containing protein 3A-like [Oncorhynchus keta]